MVCFLVFVFFLRFFVGCVLERKISFIRYGKRRKGKVRGLVVLYVGGNVSWVVKG